MSIYTLIDGTSQTGEKSIKLKVAMSCLKRQMKPRLGSP